MDYTQDYTKWQRTRPVSQQVDIISVRNIREITNNSRPSFQQSTLLPFVVKRESACSTRCKHGPKANETVVRSTEKTEVAPDTIQILKYQIKAKKSCILVCRKQIMTLLEDNIKLKHEIENTDKMTHGDVDKLLRKYHKLGGAMGTITREEANQKLIAAAELDKVKNSTENLLLDLEEKLNAVQEAVLQQQMQLKTLINYKDKEYPEKIQNMTKLKKELEVLREAQVIDIGEITKIVDVESAKYKGSALEAEQDLLKDVRTNVVDTMDRKVKEMAIQNMRFKREIEIYKNEREKLEEEVQTLEKEIRRRITEDQPEMKRRMFPGVFMEQETCSPDMEIVLRIPRQEFAPI